MNNEIIWLAYVGLPYTTAAYYERALRKQSRVVTVGPRPSEDLIKNWDLHSLRDFIKPHDLDVSYTPDMGAVYRQYGGAMKPSLYLWIESAGKHFPENLHLLPCPKACIFIDSHINLSYQLEWAKNFDYIFVAQLLYVEEFTKRGLNAHWLPLAADEQIHSQIDPQKIHEIAMVGSIFPGTRRSELIEKIKSKYDIYLERCFLEDMSRVYSQSKIVFNNAINNDLNMRVFEAMSTGSLLLTDLAQGSGQAELFRDAEDYVIYQDDNILEKIARYLHDDSKREAIAIRGRNLIQRAHLYSHRATDLLQVSWGLKPRTDSPNELRDLSCSVGLEGAISHHFVSASPLMQASYVIPVLDYSPASPYNIKTLLNDLTDVPGEVIVVFNNEKVADEIKNHPRINQYSILKNNVGVSRAWNIGINMSRTPYTFILNSDLHIQAEALMSSLDHLKNLDNAALVGPQGAFVDFKNMRDYFFLQKGSFDMPIEVDAVSGFFFVISNALFSSNGISFDNQYTPCYREEWDIGLQLKSKGLKCYAVPVREYDHQWSGSIRSYKKIRFYDQEQTPEEILERTGADFKKKWHDGDDALLESKWKHFAMRQVEDFLKIGRNSEADQLSSLILSQFINDKEIYATRGIVEYYLGNKTVAIDFYKKALVIDNNYSLAIDNIKKILNE